MVTPPADRPDSTLQEEIPEINTKDIAPLETWAVEGLQTMATPTTESRSTTLPRSLSTPGSVSQEARRKAEERTKRRAEELASKFGSSAEEEEEDLVTLNSNDKEYRGSETPSQSNLVDELETPPFKMNRPATRSTPKKPTARPKHKATQNQSTGPSSKTRKKRRG